MSVKPHNTEMKGNSGTQLHGSRPPEAHEEEVRKADCNTGESNKASEKSGEQDSKEMKEADE